MSRMILWGVVEFVWFLRCIEIMSTNIVDQVHSVLDGHTGVLSHILDESETKTNGAINAAIPSLFAGLKERVSTPEGCDEVFRSLDDYDGQIVESWGGLLSGGNHDHLLGRGTDLCSRILGQRQTSLFETIARSSGIGNSKAGHLMSLVAPLVAGTLGQARREGDLDSQGVARLVNDSYGQIADELPDEVKETFATNSSSTSAVAKHEPTFGDGSVRANQPVDQSTDSALGSLFKTLLPLAILGAIGWYGYTTYFRGGVGQNVTQKANYPAIALPGFDTNAIGKSIDAATQSIGKARDATSAADASAALKEAQSVLDEYDMDAVAGSKEKGAVVNFLGELLPKFRAAVEKAYSNPGVESELKPAVEEFLGTFAELESPGD